MHLNCDGHLQIVSKTTKRPRSNASSDTLRSQLVSRPGPGPQRDLYCPPAPRDLYDKRPDSNASLANPRPESQQGPGP
eukprot:2634714-Prorocentrum_lima.AAC.1